MFKKYVLSAEKYSDIEIEIKFEIAKARVDGIQLIAFLLPIDNDEPDFTAVNNSVTRILRILSKNKKIEFYLSETELENDGTRQYFLKNKFSDCLKRLLGEQPLYFQLFSALKVINDVTNGFEVTDSVIININSKVLAALVSKLGKINGVEPKSAGKLCFHSYIRGINIEFINQQLLESFKHSKISFIK